MGPLDLLLHLLSFVAPALAVALLVSLAARILQPKRPGARRWWVSPAINFIVGAAVLAGGLWYFGRDGKMATYAALVLACASSQWLLGRGWRS
jgi:hypothetical protein